MHDNRLLITEDRHIKRLTKRLLAPDSPVSLPKRPKLDESTEDLNKDDEPISPPSIESQSALRKQWREELVMEFAQFDSNIVRAQFVLNSNVRERDRYAEEKISIQDTAQTVKENNTTLHEQLKQAQDTLETRKGYDNLTEKISNNKTLKPRDEQYANIDKLNAEIAELEAESREFARTRSERAEQFGRIVAECKQLQGLIHGDKEEVERKEGMGDDSDDRSSRGGTPAGNSTPAHVSNHGDGSSPSQGSKPKEEAMGVTALEQRDPDDKMVEDTEALLDKQVADENIPQTDSQSLPESQAVQPIRGGTPVYEHGQMHQEAGQDPKNQAPQDKMDET